MEFLAGRVWDDLQRQIDRATRRRVAIAFAGRTAPQILRLQRDDILVVNGSDASLAAGAVHPDAIEAWRKMGVEVWSLPDLHAKVILLHKARGYRTAVVGSANASESSRDVLDEAAIVTDDETVCDAVSEQLDIWVGLADEIDDEWLAHARKVYREPRRTPRIPTRRMPTPNRAKPLWIGTSVPTDDGLSRAAEETFQQVKRRHGHGAEVNWWRLRRGDERKVLPGHVLVLVTLAPDREEPHGNASAWPPAVVVRVEPGNRRDRPVAFFVRDPNLRPRRFSEVRRAVESAGGAVELDAPVASGSVADAVYALWFREADMA
ncbi:hypothetical protein ACN26Y_21450 [Micromonospora sp. WMMD558]|uniref:hypothetical protein n=1 Tax=Micromonospora sp. WMMD558 TaxID=3403462 RepID=UPI003BF5751B